MFYVFALVLAAHAQSCPDLTGKFLCGKDGKFTAQIEQTSATSYRFLGSPFDLPENVKVDGRTYYDERSEVESYQARCKRGKLVVEIVTLREDQTPGAAPEPAAQPASVQPTKNNLHVVDVYSVHPDGVVERQRRSLPTSDIEAKSKMYCVPQR